MSRRSKRTSLESILTDGAQATPVTAPEPAPAPKARTLPERKPIKQQTVYLPLPVYEQMRRLAFEERCKMHDLLMEGLDRVFRDRGLAPIAELRKEG
ncbi:MAG: ribbon-helix-helix domain-containing protein [Geminicoccaceae bacterium]